MNKAHTAKPHGISTGWARFTPPTFSERKSDTRMALSRHMLMHDLSGQPWQMEPTNPASPPATVVILAPQCTSKKRSGIPHIRVMADDSRSTANLLKPIASQGARQLLRSSARKPIDMSHRKPVIRGQRAMLKSKSFYLLNYNLMSSDLPYSNSNQATFVAGE